ncbi:MAG: ATP-binding cassette domain-containing protein [Bacteroidales bacterium]|nr:ATP-binding cassette domain-containing protein [Bacteroidales bacterium]MDD4210179.1 ATP-binding cassette domain-containing protein [Bacteroidales bacterium]
MVKVENVYKFFDGKEVLHDITCQFEPGKTNLIIGQSGSGKTVLMKCLIGLYEADQGTIFYDKRDFSNMSKKERKYMRQEMGVLFQGGALFDSMTVKENIMFPLIMLSNETASEKNDRVDFCLERVNLKDTHELYPSQLSGGMKKRVAIARAIALNPKYLFCDEPNSGLDPKTSLVIDELISEITHEYQMTTIINTHDMNSVMAIGETVSFIFEGKLWWQGSNKDILNADNEELNNFVYANKFVHQFLSKK